MTFFPAKDNKEPLVCGKTFHVYNRAVGGELLFKADNDYRYFLRKMSRFILPIANIYAYCLIPNHFHLLLKIKESNDIQELAKIDTEDYSKYLSSIFGNFFNSYSKSFNKVYERQGRLFIQPFKRKSVEYEDYFIVLVNYIHRNPLHHGLVENFKDWKYSSFSSFLSVKTSKLDRHEVMNYFRTVDHFVNFHEENRINPEVESYCLE